MTEALGVVGVKEVMDEVFRPSSVSSETADIVSIIEVAERRKAALAEYVANYLRKDFIDDHCVFLARLSEKQLAFLAHHAIDKFTKISSSSGDVEAIVGAVARFVLSLGGVSEEKLDRVFRQYVHGYQSYYEQGASRPVCSDGHSSCPRDWAVLLRQAVIA